MTRLLDTHVVAPYKAAPLLLLGILLFGATASGESVLGVQLPDGAKKVGENRYRASTDYDGTLKYYRSVYPPAKFSWKAVANQPGVRAIHIALGGGRAAEGLNVYEANEEVRLYVVPAEVKPKPAKKTSKPVKKKK